jgi:SOS-response transcriptional repressor LexA
MATMSEREFACYQFIRDYIAKHDLPPSQREIAAATFYSRTAVIAMLRGLSDEGWISVLGYKSRAICILKEARRSDVLPDYDAIRAPIREYSDCMQGTQGRRPTMNETADALGKPYWWVYQMSRDLNYDELFITQRRNKAVAHV